MSNSLLVIEGMLVETKEKETRNGIIDYYVARKEVKEMVCM